MAKDIAVFYHIWTSNDAYVARFLVDEQIKRLIRAGLHETADVYCCVTGSHCEVMESVLAHYPWLQVLETNCPEEEFEMGTLKHLYSYCLSNPNLRAVGYFHTKGLIYYSSAANPDGPNMSAVNSWRHMLEWGNLDRWREAVAALEENDVVGVNLMTEPFVHFSGNFWWARPQHIAHLSDPRIAITGHSGRHAAESWIGSATDSFEVASLYGYPFPTKDGIRHMDPYFSDLGIIYLQQ
jgi:hypothetical protein